jgi:hypothetical protein
MTAQSSGNAFFEATDTLNISEGRSGHFFTRHVGGRISRDLMNDEMP